jgi:hypothetical protein
LPEEKKESEQRINKHKKILFILFPPCSGNGLRPLLIYNPVRHDFSIIKNLNGRCGHFPKIIYFP